MPRHRLTHPLLIVAIAALLAACGKGPEAPLAAAAPSAPPARALIVAPEDVRTLGLTARANGPVITGSIQPERRADLRAEVSAVVLQVLKENGEAVRRGDLLLRLDDASIRDGLTSAREAERAAGQAFEQAERQVQRLKTLQGQGMTSLQALEDAEVRRNNAQSDLLAARARVASARQQLTRTEVRAPFDGVVSERKASAGDTAQVGKELVKVIDPTSMRFEGLVSADRMHEIKLGQKVDFRINGYPGADFSGLVKRIDAAANATTRQVEVLVSFASADASAQARSQAGAQAGAPSGAQAGAPAPRVAGLYAEGRIETGSAQVLMLPETAIERAGEKAFVWRLEGNKLAKVAVQLGDRDERSAELLVKSGLAAGERILRRPSGTLADGQGFELAKPAAVPNAKAGA